MTDIITLEQFAALTTDLKETYILECAGLEDLWLIGRVDNPEEKPFFFIKQLTNPYSGVSLGQLFLHTDRPDSIFCPTEGKENPYEDGTLVAVKISLSNNGSHIRRGRIFRTSIKEVYPIEESHEIFEIIGMDRDDLKIVALAKPTLYEDGESRFVDLAAEIIKPKIATDLEDLKAQTIEHALELQNLQKQKDLLKVAEQNLEERQQLLEQLGFKLDYEPITKVETEKKDFLPEPDTGKAFLKGIQAQLDARGYQYEHTTLRQLIVALMAEQMIILSGPSGTGKTTIVKQLADVIHANYEIIPVQPSWTDKQDLLGFYNPIRKLYVPSAFLDCLIEAKQHQKRLYFICLDEINLAQIEYYLADLLSIRELDDGKIRLYSDFERKQNLNEIQWYVQQLVQHEVTHENLEEVLQNLDIDSLQHFEMVTRFENLTRYPAQFEIPENVRIIGTMNVDGAVQALSPKVIDRSFVIPIERQQPEHVEKAEEIGQYDVKTKHFTMDTNNHVEVPARIVNAVTAIRDELKKWNITYNQRFEKHVSLYYEALSTFQLTYDQLVDDVILMKLLPRLHEMVEDDAPINNLIKLVETQTNSETQSKTKLENMKKRFEQTQLYSFWS